MVRYVLPYAYLPLGIIRKAKGSIGFWALGNVAFLITAFFMMISRERGTLRETIPESTSVILCLFLLICVGTGTFIAEFSTISNESTRTWEDQLLVALKVGLGAISSITGILFTDPLLHARSFGLTVSVCFTKQLCYELNYTYSLFSSQHYSYYLPTLLDS